MSNFIGRFFASLNFSLIVFGFLIARLARYFSVIVGLSRIELERAIGNLLVELVVAVVFAYPVMVVWNLMFSRFYTIDVIQGFALYMLFFFLRYRK